MPIADTPEVGYEVDGKILTLEQVEQLMSDRRKGVVGDLVRMRDQWVSYRAQSGVDSRWRKARALYLGDDSGDSAFVDTLKNGPSPKKSARPSATRSRVVVNIVRPKVDQAVARMCEILLPVDDKNWAIKPTPVSSAVAAMVGDNRPTVSEDGTPTGLTGDDEAFGLIAAGKEASREMERHIDDGLTECGYNGEQRRGMQDAVLLGPMIMKGPFMASRVSKGWVTGPDGVSQMVVKHDVVPASARCDPWDVWFDPGCGNDHQRGAGYWHRRYVTRKEIRGLVGIPGFDESEIREVLRESPNRVAVAEGRVTRQACLEHSYELWEYHGEIEPEAMTFASLNTGDPLKDVDFGLILIINDRVVGAMPSWIEDRSLPIDVFCWRESDSDPYGYGLPWEMEHQQRVVTSAWRQVMDNARIAVGGQIVAKRKMIVPQDGNYDLYPNKIWDALPEVEDVTKAFTVFQFDSHLTELLTIANTAMQFADQETSMPQMMGGEKGNAPETVGGMVMLYNTASTVLRMRVKRYDDSMTRPHITRTYDWHMVNNRAIKLKADMQVDARGSTALLEKDIQNQTTMNLAAVTSNPRYAAYLDPKRELTMILKAFKVQPEDIMLSPEQIKKNEENPAPAPVDPRIEAAKIAAEVKGLELEDRKEDRAVKQGNVQAQMQVKREQIAYNTERERTESELAVAQMQLDRDVAISDLATSVQQGRESLAAEERLTRLKLDQKNIIFNAEAALRVKTGQGI